MLSWRTSVWSVFYNVLAPTGILIAGAVGTFLAAAVGQCDHGADLRTWPPVRHGARLGCTGLSATSTFGVSSGILAAAVFSAPALLFGAATVQPDPEFPGELLLVPLSDVPAVVRRIRGRNAFPRLCFSDTGRTGRVRSPRSADQPLFAFAHAGNQGVSCWV